ncbi:potassium channel family protein [Natronococcus occultus]|uniref:K+ transport system, NAD-binding component n=1 Tax=Natronococcus occultus SP4 TaxID=694430 RepID=L0K6Z3_9EURY|nr:NAD-binding protein [Natronococcus occultus]AGB39893.1 K+ transport system, NAD-binding component [Natronococcus occultus SP4]
MPPWISRRAVTYLGLVVVTTAVFTVAYNVGMTTWEDEPQRLVQSFEVVFQSFTTTGYGQDAPWETTRMNLLVVGMQLAGIGLILGAIDAFVVPWFQTAFRTSPPKQPVTLEDHVVICGYTPRTESFATQLDSLDRPFTVVEPDGETATELHEDGTTVVHGDPESVDVLELAAVETATAVVIDVADDVNASIVLSVQELNANVPIVTVAEDEDRAPYQRIAGADTVLSPRQLLGESLAGRVPTAVTSDVDASVPISDELELVEVSVTAGSQLCGQSIAECELSDQFGVVVVGAWFDGEFESPVEMDLEVTPDTRLLVAGDPKNVDELRSQAHSTVRDLAPQRVLIAGYDESGEAAAKTLGGTTTQVTILDIEDKPGVDVVGDAREPGMLREAGIEDASAVIVTVGDDTTAIFVTLVVQDLNAGVDVFARADREEDVQKLYRAGADDVQALATVSGRMMVSTVFEDEAALAFDKRIRVVATPTGELGGQTLETGDIRERTGTTVLAIVRDDDVITEFDPQSFELEDDDELVLAGTDENVRRFEREFG